VNSVLAMIINDKTTGTPASMHAASGVQLDSCQVQHNQNCIAKLPPAFKGLEWPQHAIKLISRRSNANSH